MNEMIPVDMAVLVFMMVGGLIALIMCAAGIIGALITGIIIHYFPSCAFSRWVEAEVFQTEYLTFREEQQDWAAKRMKK